MSQQDHNYTMETNGAVPQPVEEQKPEPHFLMYESIDPMYSMAFSNKVGDNITAACGSFISNEQNYISLLNVPPEKTEITRYAKIEHRYSPTMIKFHPRSNVFLKD